MISFRPRSVFTSSSSLSSSCNNAEMSSSQNVTKRTGSFENLTNSQSQE
jgi:hypothetical protein